MKDGIFAIYNGIEYSAAIRDKGNILLRSTDKNDVFKGFQPIDGTDSIYRCYKIVPLNEVTEVFKIINKAEYKGYTANILEEQGDRIDIEIDNLYSEEAKALQMDHATDKGIYAKWVNKSDAKLFTKKLIYNKN